MLSTFRNRKYLAVVAILIAVLGFADIASWAAQCYYPGHYGYGANQCTYRGGIVVSGLAFVFQFVGGLTPEAWTALATIFIAWFTLSLRSATLRLWDAGEKQIGELRRATDANIALELPLFVNNELLISKERGVEQALGFKNYGRSPAIITADCLIVRTYTMEPPPKPRYPIASVRLHGIDKVCTTGEQILVQRRERISDEEWSRVLKSETMLWAYGWFEYLDFLKLKRREGFCFVYLPQPHILYPAMTPSGGKWFRDTRPAYTYVEIREGDSVSSPPVDAD